MPDISVGIEYAIVAQVRTTMEYVNDTAVSFLNYGSRIRGLGPINAINMYDNDDGNTLRFAYYDRGRAHPIIQSSVKILGGNNISMDNFIANGNYKFGITRLGLGSTALYPKTAEDIQYINIEKTNGFCNVEETVIDVSNYVCSSPMNREEPVTVGGSIFITHDTIIKVN